MSRRVDYLDFIKGIRFRDIDPQTKRIPVQWTIESLQTLEAARHELTQFDADLTLLPEDTLGSRLRFEDLLAMPRMSSFAVAVIINRTVREMDPGAAYVNVGVWHGFTLLSGMIDNPDRRVVGVDNFSGFGGPRDEAFASFERYASENHSLVEMDYKDYFAKRHEGPIGFYFYDGSHSYADQLEGLRLAEPHFSERCFVLVDDTNFSAPRRATRDFVEQSQGQYELLLDHKTAWNGHPTYWNGILLLRRRG